jgi:hypothetical protein
MNQAFIVFCAVLPTLEAGGVGLGGGGGCVYKRYGQMVLSSLVQYSQRWFWIGRFVPVVVMVKRVGATGAYLCICRILLPVH